MKEGRGAPLSRGIKPAAATVSRRETEGQTPKAAGEIALNVAVKMAEKT